MKYVKAPSVNGEKTEIITFKRIVEYIGSKQIGIGSEYAKGKRYLRYKLKCSGSAIKGLYKTSFRVIKNEFREKGTYVFRYSIDCENILRELISWIEIVNPASEDYTKLNISDAKGDYFNWLFLKQYIMLRWVVETNYNNQSESAKIIYDRLPPHG